MYIISSIGDIGKVNSELIPELAESFVNTFDYDFNTAKKRGDNLHIHIVSSLEGIENAIKILKYQSIPENYKKIANRLHTSYNQIYNRLEEKYNRYVSPNVFLPRWERWQFQSINNPSLEFQFNLNSSLSENKLSKQNSNEPRKKLKRFMTTDGYEKFKVFEQGLIDRKYLNETRDKWLGNPPSLIRFYFFCCDKKILKDWCSDDKSMTKIFKYFRDLYNFFDGDSYNKPSKMKDSSKRKKTEFVYLLSY